MSELRLSNLHKKILASILELDQAGYFSSEDGIISFLNGKQCPDGDFKMAGCLISLSGRRGKSALRVLFHHQFVKRKYLQNQDGYYYSLCDCAIPIASKTLASPVKKKIKESKKKPDLFVKK